MSLLHFVSLLVVLRSSYCNHCYKHQCLLSNMSWSETVDKGYRLKIITVVTEETEGHLRFMRSAKVFNLDVEVFGLSDEWRKEEGGGKKLDKLRNSLLKYKEQKKLVLLFTDSYETILTAGKATILNKFKNTGANILISAEDYCWPDRSLKARYLIRERDDSYRYLCSAGIIGYAPSVYELLSMMLMEPTGDQELGYRHLFLDERKKYGIKWDRRSELFQNLNGYKDVVVLKFNKTNVTLRNTGYKTSPAVIHGNGPSKVHLTYLGNYVPKVWTESDGCLTCKEGKLNLDRIGRETKWPRVLIGIFINKRTPFVDSFLNYISKLDYPKERIDVFIHNAIEEHTRAIDDWMYQYEQRYKSIYLERPSRHLTDQQARNMGISVCRKYDCDYYFSIDSIVSLTNTQTLQILMKQNKKFIAPMVTNRQKYWKSNFWGDLTLEGHYIRSLDFLNITQRTRLGVWNVPYVRDVYLIKSSVLKKLNEHPFDSEEFNPYFQFSTYMREIGVFMHVTNMEDFGHLKAMTSAGTNIHTQYKHRHDDFYQIFDDTLDWEKKYIHPELLNMKNNKIFNFEQPCQDVFIFPAVTLTFCDHLIDESEHYGKWYRDINIPGGYENVATSILRNVGFEETWRHILKEYFAPIVTHLFSGYTPNFDASMDTVVKFWYIGRELPLFNDTSIFTINVALNEEGETDYEGGGETYTRYNCSIRHTPVGWATIRPGRWTHQYKNIPTTEGSRYILVSLVGK